MKHIAAILTLCAALSWAPQAFPEEATVDAVVAIVDVQNITASQVEARRAALAGQPPFAGNEPPSFELALEVEIERVVVLTAANSEFDQAARDRIRLHASERIKDAGDPKTFDPAAESAEAIDSVYKDLLIQAYLQKKLQGKTSVTPAEIKASYYANINRYTEHTSLTVRQILIRRESHPAQEAAAIVEDALSRLTGGEEFSAVAGALSEGPYAAEGGLWPPQQKGGLIEAVETAALALKEGAVSEAFESPLGWHVVKLEGRTNAAVKPFADVQGEIYNELMRAARQEAQQSLIAGLKSKAVIQLVRQ